MSGGKTPKLNDSIGARSRSILIADDHELVRQGLGHVLLHGLNADQIVEAETFDQAIDKLADGKVYLAIFDIGMPGIASPKDFAKVRRLRPDIHVVVLSGSDSRTDILAALEAGVHGYLIKSERSELLVKRIQSVLDGEIYVPPVLANLPPEPVAQPVSEPFGQQPSPAIALTGRQRDVLRLIAQGMSNKEISKKLGVAEGTVKMHVAAILRAIGAGNRAHAAAIGKQFLD